MKLIPRIKIALSAVVLATGALLPVALTSSPASASPSAFCTAVFSFNSYPKAPTSLTAAGYHAWAKDLLPYYEKLAATAPNATSKKVLGEIVTILKYYSTSSSYTKLYAYEVAHRAKWIAGTKALAAAIESCAKSLG